MPPLYRWHRGQKYWLYDTYRNKTDAIKEGLKWKKKIRKNKFIIITYEIKGTFQNENIYGLFMNQKQKLW